MDQDDANEARIQSLIAKAQAGESIGSADFLWAVDYYENEMEGRVEATKYAMECSLNEGYF